MLAFHAGLTQATEINLTKKNKKTLIHGTDIRYDRYVYRPTNFKQLFQSVRKDEEPLLYVCVTVG